MGKELVILFLLVSGGVAAFIWLYLRQPQFGRLPAGSYLKKLEASPHYVNGQFKNLLPTPMLVEDTSLISSLAKFVLAQRERPVPNEPVPSAKVDLLTLDSRQDMVIWLGHSSYFLQLGGRRILIDPVFSSYASPVSLVNRAFAGANPYAPDDMPGIDCLLISHDHWDHLDYPTVMALQSKIGQIVCPLGVGGYFSQWGFAPECIHEGDWFDRVEVAEDLAVELLPARHFSGRLLTRNRTLWAGFALLAAQRRVYYSGDGGYGPHLREIGDRFGGFDLAIMENGQYDQRWRYIHMLPEEVAQATVDIRARAVLPGHTAKFALANHPWDEPFRRITAASQDKPYRLLTPVIGQPVLLDDKEQPFSHWWETIR